MTDNGLYVKTRPNCSPGYWLCTLIPLAYITSNVHSRKCSTIDNFEYQMLSVTSVGLCLQSLIFYVYVNFQTGIIKKVVYLFLPGLLTAFLYKTYLHQSFAVSFFWGFAVTLTYQFFYVRTLTYLPESFSFGEATVVNQGFTLFLLNSILQIPRYLHQTPDGTFSEFNAIMITALTGLAGLTVVLAVLKFTRNAFIFYPLLISYAGFTCLVPVTKELPIEVLFDYVTGDLRNIFLLMYYFGLVVATVCVVSWKSSEDEKASTSTRKWFHGLTVLVFIPGVLFQCSFLYLATGVAFAVMTIFEIIRVAGIPPFEDFLKQAFKTFCDEKDCGLLAVTPFYLLIGCSLPLWISPCPCLVSDTASKKDLLQLLSGVLTVGIGDTAASVFGSRFGRCKWSRNNRSVEGTLAFIVTVSLSIAALYFLKLLLIDSIAKLLIVVAAVIVTSLMEAFTDQVDNLVLPLVFYSIVSFG
ncbi:DOLK family protein [Megaselia abdita]